ncbi:sensor histidine kinase [Kitasatospora sp. NPDC088391]|uniref:sensor histidine kinase n=1 Tax=Kitasatospora sp. NPDC088391 TaxID=3364074 RepID=UPI003815B263
MVPPSSAPVPGRLRAGRGLPVRTARTARRTLAESWYLLTAPPLAVLSPVLLAGALLLAAAAGSRAPALRARARAAARRPGDLEWRRLRALPGRTVPDRAAGALWRDAAHALTVLPLALVSAGLTALWWFVGLATASYPLRAPGTAGELRPMTLYAGDERSHVALSLGATTPGARLAVAAALAVTAFATLPLLTRWCAAARAGLGRALLAGPARHGDPAGPGERTDPEGTRTSALRRLERDLHDGPQQQLVRLALELGRAQHHFDRRPELVRAALADAAVRVGETLEELRALSRGIAPPILADRGLVPALAALAARNAVPTVLDADPPGPRPLGDAVEVAAYFVVAEALTNTAKHSGARRCAVVLRRRGGVLLVRVSDDGVGGAALAKGHGLRGLADRVRSAGGRLDVDSPPGGPTVLTAELPCP